MPFPGTSDYPDSVDTAYGSGAPRVDGADVVYDDDYNFPDIQIRNIQTYLGTTGQLIGHGLAAKGPGGIVSPVADGGGVKGIRLALRAAFSTGDLLSVGDAYDAVYTEKMRLGPAGILWALGGGDFGSGQFLRIPHGNALPGTFEEGRLFHKDDVDKVYASNGSAWNAIGGGAYESFLDIGGDYQYAQINPAIEETVGLTVFNGAAVHAGSSDIKPVFRAMVVPTFGVAGTGYVRLYDNGPAAGPPGVPRIVTTLSFSTGGDQFLSQDLTTVVAAPTGNQILNAARMYEAVVYQTSQAGDDVYVGSACLAIENV